MADFVAVIRKAVDGLAENSSDHRQRVYQKARSAIRRQLENMTPRPSEEVMRRQLDKLEAAIGEVELEHAEALPALEEEVGSSAAEEKPESASPRERSESSAAPEAVPAATGGARRQPPAGDAESSDHQYGFDRDEPQAYELEAAREDDAARAAAESTPADTSSVPPSPFGEEPLIGEAHDEVFGLGTPDSARLRRRKRDRTRGLVAALGAVVVLVAVAYGLWANRTTLIPMIASLTSSEPSTPAPPATSDATAPKAETPPTKSAEKQPATGEALPPGGKYTERLMADGSETNPGPAAATDEQPAEGHSVSSQTASSGEGTPSQPGPTENAAGTAAQSQPAAISQKMYLYEERFNDQAPAATTGSVVWTLAKESPGGNAPPEPAIHGEISVPGKGITALVTIKRNADKSLPASHLIEIVFALPGDFDGGGIDSVQRVSLKQTEEARGDPLIAVPAKITDNFFMVALNDYPQAVKNNLELLKSRNWIDIPVTYTNGRRALITLEKGASGTEVFDEALKVWAAKTDATAGNAASGPADAGTGGNQPASNPSSTGGTGTPPAPSDSAQ